MLNLDGSDTDFFNYPKAVGCSISADFNLLTYRRVRTAANLNTSRCRIRYIMAATATDNVAGSIWSYMNLGSVTRDRR